MSSRVPAGRGRGDGPLRRRDFRLLWLAVLVSDTGDWLLIVGLPVYVFGVTGSGTATSAVLAAELGPALLLGSFAGVLVDRWDCRRLLVATTLAQAVLLVPLLAAATPGRLWLVYVVAAAEGCLARLSTPARAALVPALVDARQLTAANSLGAVSDNTARLVGSPLGGLVVEVLGMGGVVVLDAASFAVAAALVALVRVPAGDRPGATATATAPPAGVLRQWREGVALVRRSRTLSGLFAITALGELAQGVFVVLFVVFVARSLSGGGTEIGVLRGVQAVGGVLGGLAVAVLGRRMSARTLVVLGFLTFGLVSLATWNGPVVTTSVWPYAGLFAVVGVPGVAATTGMLTLVQTHTPRPYLGRVFATVEAAGGATQALGLVAAGLLADHVGVVAVLDGQACVYLACGVLALAVLPHGTGTAAPRAGRPVAHTAGRVAADP